MGALDGFPQCLVLCPKFLNLGSTRRRPAIEKRVHRFDYVVTHISSAFRIAATIGS